MRLKVIFTGGNFDTDVEDEIAIAYTTTNGVSRVVAYDNIQINSQYQFTKRMGAFSKAGGFVTDIEKADLYSNIKDELILSMKDKQQRFATIILDPFFPKKVNGDVTGRISIKKTYYKLPSSNRQVSCAVAGNFKLHRNNALKDNRDPNDEVLVANIKTTGNFKISWFDYFDINSIPNSNNLSIRSIRNNNNINHGIKAIKDLDWATGNFHPDGTVDFVYVWLEEGSNYKVFNFEQMHQETVVE